MPTFQIEMLWDCPSCDTDEIGGTTDNCPNCGAAHDTKVSPWYMPGDTSYKARIQDERKLRMAQAGPNWSCPHCGGTQRNGDGDCLNCSAPKPEKVHRTAAPSRMPAPPPDTYSSDFEPIPPDNSNNWLMAKIVGGVTAAVALVGLLLWVLFHQEPVNLTVSSVRWTQIAAVDRYQQVGQDGFRENIPTDAENIQEDGRKIHHYDHVLDHVETEHYTVQVSDGETCVDVPETCYTTPVNCTPNDNGTASCSGGDEVCSGGGQSCTPKYRDEDRTREREVYRDDPVYAMSYTWTVWRWVHNRDVPRSGSTTETSWPTDEEICLECRVGPGEKERVARRSGSYEVHFLDAKHADTYDYEPKSEEEFQRFPLKSEHHAMYSIAGGLDFQLAINAK